MKAEDISNRDNTITDKLTLNDMHGEWYVVASNFPMWIKGDKQYPRFNYDVEVNGTTVGLRDEVRYVQDNKPRVIKGFDKPLNQLNTAFEWRGEGLLWLIRSRWQIINYDKQNKNWLVIFFKKTLFTPSGIDIVSRKPMLPPAVIDEIMQLFPAQQMPLQPIEQRV
jgi:hypothetical protein